MGTKNVNTSFLMMPLRLETMFQNHEVEEIDEPERIFYTLKQAWELLWFMRKRYNPEAEKKAVGMIEKLHIEVEKLDVLYAQDKYLLIDILKKMKDLLPNKAEIHDDWTVLIGKAERLQSIDSMKFNRATDLLNQLEHHTRRLLNTRWRPPFDGKKRKQNNSGYSQTAIYKAGFKHFKECRRFIASFPDKLETVPWMTKPQIKKLAFLLVKWNIGSGSYSNQYRLYSLDKDKSGISIEGDKVPKSVKDAKNNFDSEWGNLSQYFYTVQDVIDIVGKVTCKKVAPYRYTKVVAQIFDMVIFARKNNHNYLNQKRLTKLKNLLEYTVFDYSVQQEFVRDLFVDINLTYHANVEYNDLNKYNKYIFKKKMMYKKQKKCLCIRIYPDELAVTQTIRPLSKNEYLSGRDFWLKYIFATEASERESLWLGICDLYPAYRAAWIVRKTFPSKSYDVLTKRAFDFRLEEKTFEEYAEEINSNFLNAFPMTYVDDEQQVFDIPTTDLLPERFILQAVLKTNKNKTTTICKYGHRLPQTLQLGIDLNNMENAVNEAMSQGHIFLNGSLRWMTDYDEAERMGMAITLPLDQFDYERLTMAELKQNKIEFDKNKFGYIWDDKAKLARQFKNNQHRTRSFFFDAVYVLGINKESESECEKILSDLLDAHLYSDDGYSLLNIGTATNIITDEDQKTNAELFDTSDEALIEKYKHQPENCVNPPVLSPDEDLALLQKLFALQDSVLGNIKDRYNRLEHREILKSRKANATLIEKIDNKIVELFKNNDELKEFLTKDVLARGPFPPIRIGSQPYGILPICDFRRLHFDQTSTLYVMQKILLYLTEKWNHVADKIVSYCAESETITTEDYMKIAGSTPISSYFQKVQSVKETFRDGKNGEQYKDLLLQSNFFKFTDRYGHFENEQYDIIAKLLSFLGDDLTVDDITPYLNGYDEIRIIEKEGENNYHQDFSNLQLPNLVSSVKNALGDLLTETEEAKRDEEAKNLVIEFFDLFAYRLDAWMMGLLSNKLRKRIGNQLHRIAIGSYGWVFNLQEPDSERERRKREKQKESGEYILAPSVNQAVTGAVLRSSYKNSRVNGMTDYNLCVNLSSERVRNAIRIIEGVQNGLAIGTILGTDLERLMHDAYKTEGIKLELDEGILNLRKLYPMVKSQDDNTQTNTSAENEDIKDNDITVVNGAKLLEDYRAAEDKEKFIQDLEIFFDKTKIIENVAQDLVLIQKKNAAMLKLIDRIDDEYDALTDVILSEGVYKLTQGEREAVDALMQALDTGKNIPMPQVAEIPITSAQVDGNLVVALSTAASSGSKSLIANVEPKVNQWLNDTLNANKLKVGFQVEDCYSEPKSMQDLEVSASEMVYLSANRSAFLRYLETKNWLQSGVFEEFTNDIQFDDNMSFDEMELMLDNMRELLANARILRNDDLVKETGLPEEAVYETLQEKYDMAYERVQVLVENMSDLLDWQQKHQDPEKENYDTIAVDDEKMREALQLAVQCFSIGQTTAMDAVNKQLLVGTNSIYGDSKALLETVKSQHTFFEKLTTLHDNLIQALEEAAGIVANATEKTFHTYTEAIQKLLVSNMLIVPAFIPDANVPLQLLHEQKSTSYFKNVSAFTIDDDIQSLSKVSQQMMRFHQLRLFQKWNALGNDEGLPTIVPMQLPIIGDKPMWLGIEVPDEKYVNDAFTYLVAQPDNLPSPDDEKPLVAGIVLDHWIERIPYQEQTAGLAFNFDQPDAEAPQALLLAVSTKDNLNNYWSEDMLLRTVRSAMHLVKCRSVEPDDLKQYAWTAGLFPLINYTDNPSK